MIESTVSEQNQEIFQQLAEKDHELVMFCHDHATGLKAIVAVHNTTLGPGVGGTRMWPYATDVEALTDALRLSRGMTLKNALAGLEFGGGKAVIIGDSRKDKSEALLRRYGRFINNLGGKYYTAEDVGMTMDDMAMIHNETDFVAGLSEMLGGSGEPSVVTAYGTYLGIKASLKHATGSESLEGKTVTVQGAGSVGVHLIDLLVKDGAQVHVYDIYPDRLARLKGKPGVHFLEENEVYTKPVDVFSPCALGGILNPDTIPELNCQVIAGAANNQLLEEERDGKMIQERGIFYAPDFAVNAGGIINISVEFEGVGYNRDLAFHKTERIYDTVLNIFKLAADKGITTHQAARQLAEERIQRLGNNLKFL